MSRAWGCDSFTGYLPDTFGHSDAMLGSVTVTQDLADRFLDAHNELGQCAGPDDIYLGLRGMRTLDARLERHQRNGLVVAEWLSARPEVAEILYPALPGAAGHELWKRDFTGANGLFSLELRPAPDTATNAFLDALELFGLGFSWAANRFHLVPLPREIYFIPYLPFRLDAVDIIGVNVVAVLLSVLATWYPARVASRLDPIAAIREE